MDARSWFAMVRQSHKDADYIRHVTEHRQPKRTYSDAARKLAHKAALERALDLREQAWSVCYGEGGIRETMGQPCADVLWMRFAEGMAWPDVAASAYASERSCHRHAEAALNYLDHKRSDSRRVHTKSS